MTTGILVCMACLTCFVAGVAVGAWIIGYGFNLMVKEGKYVKAK